MKNPGRALLMTALFLLPMPLLAQEAKLTLAVLGFTADQKQMLVQLEDDSIGTNLRLYDVGTGQAGQQSQPAKKSQLIPFQRGESQKVIKETRRKFKIVDPGLEDTLYPVDEKDPDKDLSFFGLMASKDRFVLAVTDRVRLGKIADIEVKQDEETKTWAKVALKSLYWTTDRKTLVAVVTQKLKVEGLNKEIDEAHAFPFKIDEIHWVEAEKDEKPPEKPPEVKPPEKSWWKFWQ